MGVVSRHNDDTDIAECLVSDGVGGLVYIRTQKVDGKYVVETADPSDFSKMPAVAMIVHKFDDTTCLIKFRGVVSGVYAGLTPGEMLFVDETGLLTDEPPPPTVGDPFMFSQNVGTALSTDVIGLDPDLTLTRRRY